MLFCSYVIFVLRDQGLIERLSEAIGAALVGNKFLQIPSKFSFHMTKKSDSSRHEIYKALKPCWLLNWVSIARAIACFPQVSRSRPAATAANLCSPVRLAQAEQENGPKSLAVDFSLYTFDYLLEQPSERLPDDQQGLKHGLKLELCRLSNEL